MRMMFRSEPEGTPSCDPYADSVWRIIVNR
jgi:hypothetical protein